MKGAKSKAGTTKKADSKLSVKKSSDRGSKKPAKKEKAKKDPNKPKRPPSAFFVFMEEFRKTYKEKHPNNKSIKISFYVPDIMEDYPNQLLPDITGDHAVQPQPQPQPHVHLHPSQIPFTRKQHVVNVTHHIRNVSETTATIVLKLRNKHQRFWCSLEGEVTEATDETFIPPPSDRRVSLQRNAEFLWDPIERQSFIRRALYRFYLTSLDELATSELETRLSLCLLNGVSAAEEEGFGGIDVDVVIEVETVDTYYQEEIELAISAAIDAYRSFIEALPVHQFDDGDSSHECHICLNHYSLGVTITRLPCSHDFHKSCIDRWLNVMNSCPICRSPIGDFDFLIVALH